MDRIGREKRVVALMIDNYCHRRHHGIKGVLCSECNELKEYALKRLSVCPKGNGKSSCRKCEIHCYAPLQRTRIRKVMAYVGPRMLLSHPLEAVRHLYFELKN